MPVYLCKPGWGTVEPWKHGVPVFDQPFPTNDKHKHDHKHKHTTTSELHSGGDVSAATATAIDTGTAASHNNNSAIDATNAQSGSANRSFYTRPVPSFIPPTVTQEGPTPIRRVRHSEAVLVDEVSVHHGKYWLRLRWPGSRGGVAGYIMLGGTNSLPKDDNDRVNEWKEKLKGAVGGIEGYDQAIGTHSGSSGDLNGSQYEGQFRESISFCNF